jgi:hypothetical protein
MSPQQAAGAGPNQQFGPCSPWKNISDLYQFIVHNRRIGNAPTGRNQANSKEINSSTELREWATRPMP